MPNRTPMLPALAALAAGAGIALVAAAEERPAGPDVLLIHGGGTPTETFGKFTAENVDAVSCPTPVGMNCNALAKHLAGALARQGVGVRSAPANMVGSRHDILGARLVVLISPSYFGSASWKMHKLFHEKFWEIHTLGGERLGGKPFALLALGKSEPRCQQTLAAMEDVVKSCNGTAGPTLVVTLDTKPEDVEQKVAALAEAIAAKLR